MIGVLLLASLCQGSTQDPRFSAQRRSFLSAGVPKPPRAGEIAVAKRFVDGAEGAGFDRAAVLYWLAMVDRRPGPYVRRLVKSSQKAGVGPTEKTDALGALPEALVTLARVRRSSEAVDEILTLDLDGGPGDTLSGIRTDLMVSEPSLLSDALYRFSGGSLARVMTSQNLRGFREDLATEIEYEPTYAKKLRAVALAKKPNGSKARLFSSIVEKMLRIAKPQRASQQR